MHLLALIWSIFVLFYFSHFYSFFSLFVRTRGQRSLDLEEGIRRPFELEIRFCERQVNIEAIPCGGSLTGLIHENCFPFFFFFLPIFCNIIQAGGISYEMESLLIKMGTMLSSHIYCLCVENLNYLTSIWFVALYCSYRSLLVSA